MRTYWYRGEGGRNFGDALVPVLYDRLLGVELEWAEAAVADLFVIGSNLEVVPDRFRGTVLGMGMLRPTTRRDLRQARVLALRGALTAAAAGVPRGFLGDPGLLAPDLLPERPAVEHAHGVIRHSLDRRRLRGHRINILGPVEEVVRQAATCERISSSSLHGLVLADALGIPNRWLPHPSAPPLKFVDYASAYGEEIIPGQWRLADQRQVAHKRQVLLALLPVALE